MSDPIQMICNLTNCSEQDAKDIYAKTNSVLESVDLLLERRPVFDITKFRKTMMNHQEQKDKKLEEIRELMRKVDENIATSLSQREPSVQDGQISLREETAPQNSYSQQYQPASQESVVQKPETVCQLQFEYSYDLLLNGQT